MDRKANILTFLILVCVMVCGCSAKYENQVSVPQTTTNSDTHYNSDCTSISIIPSDLDTEEYDLQTNSLNIFCAEHNNNIIYTQKYDIDDDGIDEFLILAEGVLLYNSRELHCYKENNNDILYCGSIAALQSELNDDIYNTGIDFSLLKSIPISEMSLNGEVCNVLAYSVYTFAAQYNYISRIFLDDDGQISLEPILMWGIDKKDGYSGSTNEKHILLFNGNSSQELSEEELQFYLSLIE